MGYSEYIRSVDAAIAYNKRDIADAKLAVIAAEKGVTCQGSQSFAQDAKDALTILETIDKALQHYKTCGATP